ncbi:MAG: secondary thiamine-phosphate synthase enzyme YjbQ [Thermoplasmata archaeon]
MVSIIERMNLSTRGEGDIIDLTEAVALFCRKSGLKTGLINVFVPGSTGAVTTIEYEPGLIQDTNNALNRLFPKDISYNHDRRWGDGNGRSHVRASFIGPSLSIPVENGALCLGTWQQVVFIELDIRSRNREIVLTAVGEN